MKYKMNRNSLYTFLNGSTPSGPQEPKSENTLQDNSELSQRMKAMEDQRKEEFGGIQRKWELQEEHKPYPKVVEEVHEHNLLICNFGWHVSPDDFDK